MNAAVKRKYPPTKWFPNPLLYVFDMKAEGGIGSEPSNADEDGLSIRVYRIGGNTSGVKGRIRELAPRFSTPPARLIVGRRRVEKLEGSS
jgi:hypothetical protein